MKRLLVLVFGVISYLVFLGTFVYAIGFLGNVLVPKTIDSPADVPWRTAFVVNLVLLTVFALPHSVMARPGFKRWWTRFVPQPAERSTYVLFSSLALMLMFWQWQPMGHIIWAIESPLVRAAVYILYGLGWILVLLTTCLINHFDLFGLRQAWVYFTGRALQPIPFMEPGPYKLVRHPLYVGWLIVFWSAPTMTVARLMFALATTTYILVAIQFEERDLVRFHREYSDYKRRVPMLIPFRFRSNSKD